ncbi:MAG: antitoxin [Propionibacteriaceae bacterium]|jgi:hypothetical protein|nr:antitoxin [Propionibacteriaceae bacterium]
MADLLIRDVPKEAVQAIGAAAQSLGLSRNEYLRRQLIGLARPTRAMVSLADLQRSSTAVEGVLDAELMEQAWR